MALWEAALLLFVLSVAYARLGQGRLCVHRPGVLACPPDGPQVCTCCRHLWLRTWPWSSWGWEAGSPLKRCPQGHDHWFWQMGTESEAFSGIKEVYLSHSPALKRSLLWEVADLSSVITLSPAYWLVSPVCRWLRNGTRESLNSLSFIMCDQDARLINYPSKALSLCQPFWLFPQNLVDLNFFSIKTALNLLSY